MSARGSKLRFARPATPFRIVLVEPEIPQNTGSIGRLCAATGSSLHLVGGIGFDMGERAVRRAGLDYWGKLDVHLHPDMDSFLESARPTAVHLVSSWGGRSYLDVQWAAGAAKDFGRESTRLPDGLVERFGGSVVAIPTLEGIRSLNVANAVSVVLYEALRSTGALGATTAEITDC